MGSKYGLNLLDKLKFVIIHLTQLRWLIIVSLQFSDTTNKRGIIELIDANVNTNATQYPVVDKTRDVNLALDRVFALIFQVGGTWQFDDSNQTDYPIITTALVSGQRDYSFTTDANLNLILEIYRVLVADASGIFHDVFPVDVNQKTAPNSFTDGQNTGGQPFTYDKLANGIFLDPIPNYSKAGGLKVYINREGSYFAATDTTKKPGFAGLFHEYLALRPAWQYAVRKGLSNAQGLQLQVLQMEQDIMDYYKGREKDTQKKLRPVYRNSR